MKSVLLITGKVFPEYDLKTRSIPGTSFHCLPTAPQEVMPVAGSGAAKGKGAANRFSLYEVTSSRKENTQQLLELVWFPTSQVVLEKRKYRGEVFLIWSNKYSRCGIPWK